LRRPNMKWSATAESLRITSVNAYESVIINFTDLHDISVVVHVLISYVSRVAQSV
jgi:hypothetical protein